MKNLEKTIVLNHFNKKALVSNVQDAVNFINSLQYVSANETTIANLTNFFNGTNKYPLNDIATTGCGSSRILVYQALADTLEKHDEILKQRHEQSKIEAEKKFNEFKEGTYTVELQVIRLQGGTFYKTIKVPACSKNDAYNKATSLFWENNITNAIQVVAKNIEIQ